MANPTTLRLLFPQWQGGGDPSYRMGTRMLAWLAPDHEGPLEEVGVAMPEGAPLDTVDGVLGREDILRQHEDARQRIEKHRPDRIVVFGGDCGVDLVPFAYLNERYGGDLAVLWIDAHSDLFSNQVLPNSNAHVLGSLHGEGDAQFSSYVKVPIKPGNALIAGWQRLPDRYGELQAFEDDIAERMRVSRIESEKLADDNAPVIEWLRATGARHVAIHFDLDVLDADLFRSLTFNKPGATVPTAEDIRAGQMTLAQVVRLLDDVAEVADVVGIGITELVPWDAIALQDALRRIPLVGRSS